MWCAEPILPIRRIRKLCMALRRAPRSLGSALVMWHVAKYGDPYSEFVLCIYPSKVHTPWTHTRSSVQPFMLRRPGSSWGFGALLKDTSVLVLYPRWQRDLTQRPLRVPKTVLLCRLMLFVRLKTLSIYREFIRNSLRNTSMIAKAFWISATHTNTNSRRRLLRSYKAFVYFGSRTSRPWPRLLMLPTQGGVASGVREDGSAVSAEVYERG